MATITGKFIKSILRDRGKTIVDDEILEREPELENNIEESPETNLTGKTTAITGEMKEISLEVLKKSGKTEIDKEVLAEIEKMVEA